MTEEKTVLAPVVFYVRSGDGKMYKEVPRVDGDYDYVEAEKGLGYTELPDGKFVATRDMEAAQYLQSQTGHERYFEQLDKDSKKDPKLIKQNLKRLNALERRLQLVGIDQALPPTGMAVEQVTDEQFIDLMSGYKKAVEEGHQKQSEFQPFVTYAHKLTTKSGKIVRPKYKGEVGMKGSTVLVLEAGYDQGSSVQVPETVIGSEVADVDDDRVGEHRSDDGGGDVHSPGGESGEGALSGEEGSSENPGPQQPEGVHVDSGRSGGSNDDTSFNPWR